MIYELIGPIHRTFSIVSITHERYISLVHRCERILEREPRGKIIPSKLFYSERYRGAGYFPDTPDDIRDEGDGYSISGSVHLSTLRITGAL